MCDIDCLRGAPSGARDPYDPVGWVRGRLGKARAIGRRKGARCGDADSGAPRLGPGKSGFPPAIHLAIFPGGTKEQIDWFNELQRISTSPEDAVRNLIATGDTDVSALLTQVSVPTLVMHSRDDARVPFDHGRRLAAGIPGARFVLLASRNHLILEDEPAFPRFLQEMRAFLA
jgi:pimeloyl-ACP methyl ester carboxylesterase